MPRGYIGYCVLVPSVAITDGGLCVCLLTVALETPYTHIVQYCNIKHAMIEQIALTNVL